MLDQVYPEMPTQENKAMSASESLAPEIETGEDADPVKSSTQVDPEIPIQEKKAAPASESLAPKNKKGKDVDRLKSPKRSTRGRELMIEKILKENADRANIDRIYGQSFNAILRTSADLIESREFLEQTRDYYQEKCELEKALLEANSRRQEFKRYVRCRAKVALLNTLLSDDTMEAYKRLNVMSEVAKSS